MRIWGAMKLDVMRPFLILALRHKDAYFFLALAGQTPQRPRNELRIEILRQG